LAFAAVLVFLDQYSVGAVVYSDGDLFLGFRATGGTGATQTYLVNIGQASVFRDAATGSSSNLALGNLGADLAGIYGGTWFNRSDLFWGVAGAVSGGVAGDPANTLYASRAEPTVGTLADAWLRKSNNAQTTTVSKIQGAALGYLNAGNSTANSTFAVIQNTTDPNNWASFQPGGANATGGVSFGAFQPTIEGGFANGVAGTRLDLFSMTTSATTGLPGTYQGTFAIDQNGAVNYMVVPEPTALALLGVFGGALGLTRHRRRTAALSINPR